MAGIPDAGEFFDFLFTRLCLFWWPGGVFRFGGTQEAWGCSPVKRYAHKVEFLCTYQAIKGIEELVPSKDSFWGLIPS